MRIRRNAIAVVTAAALSTTVAVPAQAATTADTQTSQGSSETSKAELSSQLGSYEGSSENSDTWWSNLHPLLKFVVGVFSATAIFTAFGMLRTLFYNIFGA